MVDVANLEIKPGKCKVVCLAPAHFGGIDKIKNWISLNIPEWSKFGVVDTAE